MVKPCRACQTPVVVFRGIGYVNRRTECPDVGKLIQMMESDAKRLSPTQTPLPGSFAENPYHSPRIVAPVVGTSHTPHRVSLLVCRLSTPDHVNDLGVRLHPCRCPLVGQLLLGVVPVQASDAAVSLLVGISLTIILIEHKLGICSGIDPQPRDFLWMLGALNRFSQRQDRPGANKKRQRVNGRTDLNRLSTMHTFVRPIVVPVGAGRKVNRAAGCALLDHRSHQECWAKQVAKGYRERQSCVT